MEYWESFYSGLSPDQAPCSDGWLGAYADALREAGSVLDLGCGAGANAGQLLEMGLCVTAADLSPSAAALVSSRFPGVQALSFDMTQGLPFEADSFGAVVADLSLHYFSWADTQKVVDGIARVLRPGGVLLARVHAVSHIDPAGLQKIEENYYVVDGCPRRYFTGGEIRTLFARWRLERAQEITIGRYGMTKRVFEIAAVKTDERAEG